MIETDRVAHDVLQCDFPGTPQDMIANCSQRHRRGDVLSAIRELRKWHVLFTERDVVRFRDTLTEAASPPKRQEGPTVPVWLCVSNDCNLRCEYCSAGFGRFGGEPALMSKETARKAIEFLIGGRDMRGGRLDLVLIGGEPLINFEVVRFAIDFVEEFVRVNNATYRVGLNTNGTVLTDEMITYLSKRPVDMVFSIDGPDQVHNKNRRFPDGNESYMIVAANLKRWLAATGRPCRVQATITDISDMEAAIKHFYEIGIRTVLANPALKTRYSRVESNPSATEEDEIVSVYRSMAQVFIETVRRGDPRALFSTIQLMGKIHRREATGPGCGAGNPGVVDSYGNIYPCQGMVGWKEYKLGDVISGADEIARARFIEQRNALVGKCFGCWAQSICGAACIATAIANGILDAEYPSVECDLRKRMAEIAIETYAELMATAPEAADKLLGARPHN